MKNGSQDLGFLNYAFRKTILSVFVKFKIASMVLLLIGASVWDASRVTGSLIIGIGIGVFIATLFNEAGVRGMFVSSKARRVGGGKILVEKEGVILEISEEGNVVNWLDKEKTGFWFTSGYLFCSLSENATPSSQPKHETEKASG